MKAMQMVKMLPKLAKPQTNGMRRNWFIGPEAMMTVVRVLPPALYEAVVAGKKELPPGSSVPGSGPGMLPKRADK